MSVDLSAREDWRPGAMIGISRREGFYDSLFSIISTTVCKFASFFFSLLTRMHNLHSFFPHGKHRYEYNTNTSTSIRYQKGIKPSLGVKPITKFPGPQLPNPTT